VKIWVQQFLHWKQLKMGRNPAAVCSSEDGSLVSLGNTLRTAMGYRVAVESSDEGSLVSVANMVGASEVIL
jgi:hypothetical protein